MEKLQEDLANLVFSVPSPHLSLDARLKPFEEILRAAYALGRQQERERCAAFVDAWEPTGRASDMDALAAALRAEQPGAEPGG